MAKTKTDIKVNKAVKKFNKTLKADVFDGRFWVRQYQKTKYNGVSYYLYELIDNLEPERNYLIRGWINGKSPFFMSEIYEAMNDFIVKSDFWSIFYSDPSRYDKKIDDYSR